MNGIEREIIKTTNYKVLRKFDDRQDYLMSLLNATEKLSDDDFDNLSSEAAEWVNAAVEAHNSKNQDIPDFDEVPPDDDEDGADNSEESNDDDSSGDDQPADDEAETEPVEGETTNETDDTTTEPEAEPAEEKPAKRKGKAKKAKEPKEPKKPVHAKREPTTYVKPKIDPLKRGSDEDVVLDKWGTMEGSKNSRALAMFEKGATTNEVRVKLDGTYYNILKKMVENGHKVEKVGSMITLTHRDATKRPKK